MSKQLGIDEVPSEELIIEALGHPHHPNTHGMGGYPADVVGRLEDFTGWVVAYTAYDGSAQAEIYTDAQALEQAVEYMQEQEDE